MEVNFHSVVDFGATITFFSKLLTTSCMCRYVDKTRYFWFRAHVPLLLYVYRTRNPRKWIMTLFLVSRARAATCTSTSSLGNSVYCARSCRYGMCAHADSEPTSLGNSVLSDSAGFACTCRYVYSEPTSLGNSVLSGPPAPPFLGC
jgi:hypothetical protein